ncbi:dynamin family GTPase [Naegleria gruberi]|uniref:Dynamin family GTPase n=1 Tax=Naegleria gruberi TaxID=5762 RepID=D2UYI8_NAEGR|nr:dynamin family GTPase [Naegleria gruberi]EFC50801.1 dynamin family GTPase [Naegleria gruberi]|eukprot:XP_002683545.1 dynamin family GTPase [Naegleria gruberi strain NEG-M]
MKRKEHPSNGNAEQKKVKQSYYEEELTFSPPHGSFGDAGNVSSIGFDESTTLSQNLDNSMVDESGEVVLDSTNLDDSGFASQTLTNPATTSSNYAPELSSQEFEGFSVPSSPVKHSSPTKTPSSTDSRKSTSNSNQTSNSAQKKPSVKSTIDKQKLKEKVEKERQLLTSILQGNSKENKLLYEAFNNLQTVANEHKLKFEAPELVVVGMQSDGKSSFVEALLGFQFNTVDTQIGTRRPLILQMVNDPSSEKPLCHFFKEASPSDIEEEATPVPLLEKEIRRRTDEVCGKGGVSSRPIVLRVKYKYCANLTIYDTPGFRKGDTDPLGERIHKTVMGLIKPQNRIIVALEQSTVEWCNTQVRPIIKKADPNFERTIFVITKFNNRNNQFRDGKEANDYISTDGNIQDLSKVFYISLPSGHGTRNIAEEEFKNEIVNTYLKDFKKLTKVGFDEQKYKSQLGFYNLKRYLEKLLNEKYVENISPVLTSLENLLSKRKIQLEKITSELDEIEKENIESQITHMIGAYVNNVTKALNGTNQFDTLKNGLTLEEERGQSGNENWPGFPQQLQDKLPIRNRNFKLYGGAQLERLLSEFEVVSHAQEFPQTTNDEVAVSIGVNPIHTSPDYIRGVTDLAQKKCRMVFKPLIECLLQRSKFVMKLLFKLVIQYMVKNNSLSSRYKAFSNELFKVCEEFIDSVLKDVRTKTSDEFETFVKIMDWDLISAQAPRKHLEYDLLHPKEEETIERVKQTVDDSNDSLYIAFEQFKGRELTEEKCEKIKKVAAQLFAGVRAMFVKYIRAKFNAFFLDPIFTNMDNYIRVHFLNMGSDKLRELMGHRVLQLKQAKDAFTDQVKKLSQHKEMFTSLAEKFQSSSPPSIKSKKSQGESTSNNGHSSDKISTNGHSSASFATPTKKSSTATPQSKSKQQ